MNNDKLQQAGEKFREAASLIGEWLSDQFRSAIDVFSTMAKKRNIRKRCLRCIYDRASSDQQNPGSSEREK